MMSLPYLTYHWLEFARPLFGPAFNKNFFLHIEFYSLCDSDMLFADGSYDITFHDLHVVDILF